MKDDPRSYERNLMQLRKEAWKKKKKIQDFNGVWTRDLAIPVRCSNQLSYEATNVSGFIAQLVRASHRYREVTGSNPVEVLNFFQASLRNCIKLRS